MMDLHHKGAGEAQGEEERYLKAELKSGPSLSGRIDGGTSQEACELLLGVGINLVCL